MTKEFLEKMKNKHGYIEPDEKIENFLDKVDLELRKLAREESIIKMGDIDDYISAQEKRHDEEGKALFEMVERKHKERGEIPNDQLSEVAIEARILLNKYYGE